MKYDITSIIDRRGKDAIAIDRLGGGGMAPDIPKEGFDAIPMWVVDMNFPTVPTIQESIIERVKHPMYGYFDPTDEYYDSIIRWQTKRLLSTQKRIASLISISELSFRSTLNILLLAMSTRTKSALRSSLNSSHRV